MVKITPIKLDRERHLRFDLNALELIEDITGKPITEIGENVSLKVLKAMIYGGLKWEDKELTPIQVGEMISLDNIKEVSQAISDAFKKAK